MADGKNYSGSATLSDGTRVQLSKQEIQNILLDIAASEIRRATAMPTTQSALQSGLDAKQRLCELGWRSGSYKMPKTELAVIQSGSSGIFSAFLDEKYIHFSGCVGKIGDEQFMWKAQSDLSHDELELMKKCDEDSSELIKSFTGKSP